MNASYLRVKKWADLQHYKDRMPPWIKFYNRLLKDTELSKMDEFAQYQLVRLWSLASLSSVFTLDEKQRVVPALAHDEMWMRRAIGTTKKIPLEVFIREGWLIQVAEEELLSASTYASAVASAVASSLDSNGSPFDPSRRSPEKTEAEESSKKGSSSAFDDLPVVGDPIEVLISMLTDGDQHTPRTVRGYAAKLPPAAFAQVIVQLRQRKARNKTKYAVGALKKMVSEGQYAA